jgi:hypothetical protein
MRRNRVKFLPIIIIAIVFILGCVATYRYNYNKYKDMNYAVKKYITTGILNKYKLYSIDKMDVSFSDGTIAVISITGTRDKAPHENVNYKVFLEKSTNGIWKVVKVYKE